VIAVAVVAESGVHAVGWNAVGAATELAWVIVLYGRTFPSTSVDTVAIEKRSLIGVLTV